MSKPLKLLAAVLLLPIVAAWIVLAVDSPPGPMIQIQQQSLTLTNFLMQIEPLDAGVYYTNFGGTNLVISGNANFTALIGPVIHLSWSGSGAMVIQRSADLLAWETIRIVHVGNTNWWTPVSQPQMFFRGIRQ